MGLTTYEKQTLDTLKSINRNINYLGRKLELTNDILKKQGIAVMPVIEAAEPEYETMVRVSDIDAWKKNFYDNISVDHHLNDDETNMVFGWINRMLEDLDKAGKFVDIDIQKEDE